MDLQTERDLAQVARAFDGHRWNASVGLAMDLHEQSPGWKAIDEADAQYVRSARVNRDGCALSETELRSMYGDR